MAAARSSSSAGATRQRNSAFPANAAGGPCSAGIPARFDDLCLHGTCSSLVATTKRRSETNVPQLPNNNLLGLGGQSGAPDRGLASTHADRARSANTAEKRLTSRSERGEGGSVGFGQELKTQLRE